MITLKKGWAEELLLAGLGYLAFWVLMMTVTLAEAVPDSEG
jgi:hypothetical protein